MSLKKRRVTERRKAYAKMVKESRLIREKAFYGSLGGASPVRRIDPKSGDVVEVLDPETGAVLEKQEHRHEIDVQGSSVVELFH